MSTTTTNFGWTVPSDTDLVKDGAAAIRTALGGVDTSFVDLKGGTTGQVLAKASNSDLDYTWTSPNPGDITGVTAGTGITGGGTSGDVTVSFDFANYGGGQGAAGKNAVINGAMEVWQRGTSFSATGYTADRWAHSGTNAITRSTTAPAGFNYSLNWVTAGSYPTVATYIELPVAGAKGPFTGTWVASFYAKASTTTTLSSDVQWIDGSSRANPVQIVTQGNSLTTSWQRFTMPVNMDISSPAGTSKALEFVFYVATGGATVNITGVQLERGSTATPFIRNGSSIQGELAACQRYYYRQTAATSNAFANFRASGVASSTTGGRLMVSNVVEMRTIPTSIDYSNTAVWDGTNWLATTTLTIDQSSVGSTGLAFGTSGSLAANRPVMLTANNNTSAYFGLSAEL